MKERVKRAVCISLMFILFITTLAACNLPKEAIEKIEGYIVSIIKGADEITLFIGDSADSTPDDCDELTLSDKVCITDSYGNILSADALKENARVFLVAVDDMLKNAFLSQEIDLDSFTHLLVLAS